MDKEDTILPNSEITIDNVKNASEAYHSTKSDTSNKLTLEKHSHSLNMSYFSSSGNFINLYGEFPYFSEGDIIQMWFECTVDSRDMKTVDLGTVYISPLKQYSGSSWKYYEHSHSIFRGNDGSIYCIDIEYDSNASWNWYLYFSKLTGGTFNKLSDIIGTSVTSCKFCYAILGKVS